MYNMAVNPEISIAEVIPVPDALHGYVLDPKFSAILLKIKDQSGVNFISVKKPTAAEPSVGVSVDAQTADSGLFAKQLLELKFKHQMKIVQSETKLRKTQDDLFSTQGSLASGHIVEFDVPREVIGLIIGKKGLRVRQVEEDTGVQNIRVNDNEQNGTGRVTIVGKDSISVRKARELMEIKSESYPVSAEHLAYFRRASDRTLRYDERSSMDMSDLKDTAGLLQIRVDVPQSSVVVVGTVPSLRSARMLFDVHLENVNEILELEAKQKAANAELYEVKSKFGGGGGRGGAVGGRGAFGGRGVATGRDNSNGGNNNGNRGPAQSSNNGRNQNQSQNQKAAPAQSVQKPAVVESNISNGKKNGKNAAAALPEPAGKKGSSSKPPAPPAPPVSADYVAHTAAALNSIGKADGKKPKDQKPKDQKPKEAAQAAEQKPKDQKPKDQKPKDQKPKDQKPKEAAQAAEQKPKDQKPKEAAPAAAAPADAAGDKPLPKRNKGPKKDAPADK
jgi:hypothetical protein